MYMFAEDMPFCLIIGVSMEYYVETLNLTKYSSALNIAMKR